MEELLILLFTLLANAFLADLLKRVQDERIESSITMLRNFFDSCVHCYFVVFLPAAEVSLITVATLFSLWLDVNSSPEWNFALVLLWLVKLSAMLVGSAMLFRQREIVRWIRKTLWN